MKSDKETCNSIQGHEYVDLGLPSGLKWATCNVGANAPHEYGNYYAWGEVETKREYTAENCKTIDCIEVRKGFFKRRIENDTIRHAASIFIVYMLAVIVSTMVICFTDGFKLQDVLFETIAAVSTTGYSRIGIENMSYIARIIMMILMYGGRIGFMSLLMVFWEKEKADPPTQYPTEEIMIG